MISDCPCEYLEWDSDFFGKRIARTHVPRLDEQSVAEIEQWCAAEKIDCLYFLADFSDRKTGLLAQERDFRVVDVRVTLACTVSEIGVERATAASFRIRDAVEADIPALRAVARDAHRDSRFYYDGNFPAEKCEQLYETWIEKSVRGRARRVIIADTRRGPEGYLTCHLQQSGNGEIGLVGVAEMARGRGVGKSLVSHGLQWFAENGVKEVRVVTQGRNVSAQRLYQKCGFTSQAVGVWFHRWFSDVQKNK